MSGILTLIPTPISDEGMLEQSAFQVLMEAATNQLERSIFAIEDLKPGRRRWLSWGLPRHCVEHFVLYNEHTRSASLELLVSALKRGKNVYLMSDGGLPAFCDPGVRLVDRCHQEGIRVSATAFANSIALAVALSGFDHQRFVFEGFLPRGKSERARALKEVLQEKRTVILMDTPYRLERLLEEIREHANKDRQIFVGCDLGTANEECLRGDAQYLWECLKRQKREFVLLIKGAR